MDELHQQTVNLLSFQPLPKDVFDAQVAFNLVARYGRVDVDQAPSPRDRRVVRGWLVQSNQQKSS